MGERRMRLVGWKPMSAGGLVGFATVELPIGLRINECPVMIGKSGVFAGLPRKPRLGRDGHKQTSADGRTVYEDMMGWTSKKLSAAFSDRVVALVREAHPADLPVSEPAPPPLAEP